MIEQGDNWDKVMTDDGIIGYMQKRMLSSVKEKNKKKRFHSGYLCTYKERLQYLYGLASGHKPVCK